MLLVLLFKCFKSLKSHTHTNIHTHAHTHTHTRTHTHTHTHRHTHTLTHRQRLFSALKIYKSDRRNQLKADILIKRLRFRFRLEKEKT